MKNSLQNLIREAFNTAYKTHKFQKLNEDAQEKGAALNPQRKAKADEIINQVIARPEMGLNYQPYGPDKVSGNIDMAQLNYIIDSLTESYLQTKDNKYKNAISFFFSAVKRPVAYNVAKTSKKGTKNTIETSIQHTPMYAYLYGLANSLGAPLTVASAKNPNAFEEAALRAWGRIFMGGTTIPTKDAAGNYIEAGKREKVDSFDNLTKYYKADAQGFFSVIATSIAQDVRLQLQREIKTGAHIVRPSQTSTGKDMDFGDESREGVDVVDAEGQGIEDDILGVLGGKEEMGTESPEEHSFELENYKNAIREAIKIARETGAANKDALTVFEELMLNYLSYEEIAEKYPESFPYTKDAKGKIKYTKRKPNDLLRDLIIKTPNSKFNQILKQVEAKFDIPSIAEALYPVINRRADTELHQMAKVTNKDVYPAAIKALIRTAQAETGLASTKSILAFEGFALDGLSFEEIADESPAIFRDAKDAKDAFEDLLDNEKFGEISQKISSEFGLSMDVVEAARKRWERKIKQVVHNKGTYSASSQADDAAELGAQWIAKHGKKMMAQKNEPAVDLGDEEEEDLSGYAFENFLAENLDKIMEAVYKRLSKNLNG